MDFKLRIQLGVLQRSECFASQNAFSYSSCQWPEIAESAALKKRRKYDQAAENLNASFSPLICSCEGVLHRELASFKRALISDHAEKWENQNPKLLDGFVSEPKYRSSAPYRSAYSGA
ncbi:unnamed protein product [Nesidiocoris tenuis]|uniref:Uncharacterized protein n=1 Tax=Nesidiocoris tenuis TaxID=355587 RepID=A0A6H5HZD0_9HEMI|nr:unnamed protein product [Nesidiocoris tenuis]